MESKRKIVRLHTTLGSSMDVYKTAVSNASDLQCLSRMCLAENCPKRFLQPFVELQTFVFHNLAMQMRLKNAIGRGKDSQFLVKRHTWYDAPGLYKAGPRLVVVTRRLRRYFAFARGPKGVRLQGEVMKTVSRVAKVFSRGRNHMKHLVEANLQSRAFWAKRWTRPSIHVLLQHSFSPFHFCRLLLRHLWEKPWGPHCLHRKPREPPPGDCEERWRSPFQPTRCETCFSLSSAFAGCALQKIARR